MRVGSVPPMTQEEMATMTPNEAQFALTVQESPLQQLEAIADFAANDKGEVKTPPELNDMFKDVDEPFREPMTVSKASRLNERAQMRNHFKQQISYAPNTIGAKTALFTSGVIGSLVDPIGNLGMVAAGPVVRATGLIGKTLGQRIAISVTENFLANMTADTVAGIASKQIGDEFDPASRIALNLGASALFGIPGGYFEHINPESFSNRYYRQAPELGVIMEGLAHDRGMSGLDPNDAPEVFNAAMAAENSGTHFQYTAEPVTLEKPFYSGSRHFTDNWDHAAHAVREDIGTERGVQLFDNENIAHAGALTAESGSAGAVFTHDLRGKTIINGETKLSDIGYVDAVESTDKALQRHNPTKDMKIATDVDVLVHALEKNKTGKFAIDSLLLHESLHDTLLHKTLNDVGLYSAYKSFEEFARIAQMRKSEIPYYSIQDIILLMDKEIKGTTGSMRKKLTAKYADFVGAIRNDIGTKLTDLGSVDLVDAFKELTKGSRTVVRYSDISVGQAYNEIVRGYYAGDLSLADVTKFEKALGGEGIHFKMDNFRGHKQEPTNGVYIFDRNSVHSEDVKPAEIKAVGGITPDRVKSIQMEINGENRIFEQKVNKKGEAIWKEVKEKAGNNQLEMTEQQIKSKVDEEFQQISQQISEIAGIEGHLTPEETVALETAKKEFSLADKLEKVYSTIKSCL